MRFRLQFLLRWLELKIRESLILAFQLPVQINSIMILLFTITTIKLFATIPTMLVCLYLSFSLRLNILIKTFRELLYSTTLQPILLYLFLKASLFLLQTCNVALKCSVPLLLIYPYDLCASKRLSFPSVIHFRTRIRLYRHQLYLSQIMLFKYTLTRFLYHLWKSVTRIGDIAD